MSRDAYDRYPMSLIFHSATDLFGGVANWICGFEIFKREMYWRGVTSGQIHLLTASEKLDRQQKQKRFLLNNRLLEHYVSLKIDWAAAHVFWNLFTFRHNFLRHASSRHVAEFMKSTSGLQLWIQIHKPHIQIEGILLITPQNDFRLSTIQVQSTSHYVYGTFSTKSFMTKLWIKQPWALHLTLCKSNMSL